MYKTQERQRGGGNEAKPRPDGPSGNGDEDVDQAILKNACTVLAQGQTSCPSGQSLVSGCCVSDFSTWNGYGSDGECKRASGCKKPNGECTKSGSGACYPNPMCGPDNTCSVVLGSVSGTAADCDAQLPPATTLAQSKYSSYTHAGTISTTGQTTFYVPGQCVLKIKDKNGICYAIDTFQDHINSYGQINEKGIADYHTYNLGNVNVVDCDAKISHNGNGFDLKSNGGPKFVSGNGEKDSLRCDNGLTSIANVLNAMNIPDGYKFKGVYENANGSGTQYFNDKGQKIANPYDSQIVKQIYMIWEKPSTTVSHPEQVNSGRNLASGETSCNKGESLVRLSHYADILDDACCVADPVTWNGYNESGKCVRNSGCTRPDGTCTKTGDCACNSSFYRDNTCSASLYSGSLYGDVSDCDKRLPPEKTLAYVKETYGFDFQYFATTSSSQAMLIPGNCKLIVQDSNGLCYENGIYDAWRTSIPDEYGYANIDTYTGDEWVQVDCDDNSRELYFTLFAHSGPKFVIGGVERDKILISGSRKSIADVLSAMNVPAGCKFKGVYENADGTGIRYYDENGQNEVFANNHGSVAFVHMVWENCPQ